MRQSAISNQRSAQDEMYVGETVILRERGLPRVCSGAGNGTEGSRFPTSKFRPSILRACLIILLLCLAPPSLLAASIDSNVRFNKLGHKMICACGCNQILLECNHVGCPLSDGMRNELAAGLERGDSDDLILQAFVQKYGPTILAAPTTTGFNRIAWIMPFAVMFVGLAAAVAVIRSWKGGPPLPPGDGGPPSNYIGDVRRETEL